MDMWVNFVCLHGDVSC